VVVSVMTVAPVGFRMPPGVGEAFVKPDEGVNQHPFICAVTRYWRRSPAISSCSAGRGVVHAMASHPSALFDLGPSTLLATG